jgi:SAP domain-containing new25
MNTIKSPRAVKLYTSMTETEFDNGYWYAEDLKKFAEKIGIPSARRFRKDELEQALSISCVPGTPRVLPDGP